ncbi:MAG TPA: ABC transporter permease, partial [Anaerolineaceae bacterium]|nr:ABC transporter permease [Anaerolineaceae bacterium]
ALALPFTAAITLIMGSLQKAVLVLGAALVGLVGLGGALGALLWLITRLLPLRGFPLLNMARGNLRRRGFAPVFALIALFVGVVALTLAGVVTQNASRVMESASLEVKGNNLTLLAPAAQADAIAAALAGQPVESQAVSYSTRLRAARLAADPEAAVTPVLIARTDPAEYTLTGAPWGSRPDGVYLSSWAQVLPESKLEVVLWDGTVRELTVVGAYEVDPEYLLRPEMGILLPTALSQSITPPDQVQVSVRVAPRRLPAAARALGEALPDVTVINMVAYAARFTEQYHNLFLLAVSMASLALLAGMLLMANSVSLGVLDRRYEIGVLKAMGYAHRQVLVTLMVEYALIALVAASAGLAVVKGFLWLIGLNNALTANLLVMTPLAAGLVALLTLGLTIGTVLASTWKSTQVSPLVVLNDRV